jgi:glycosyltransferase involved in cell wall biosynthesis
VDLNSESYWNQRFAQGWATDGGPEQTRYFAETTLTALPEWLLDAVRDDGLDVVDWGCAEGDGVQAWADRIGASKVSGVDFSQVAIETARSRRADLRFDCADWLVETADERFDIVFSSNTLEHFADPKLILNRIAERAVCAVILCLPYREMNRHSEHLTTFTAENIPSELGNGFQLGWSRVVDCSADRPLVWDGEQIVVVYAAPRWLARLGLKPGGVKTATEPILPRRDPGALLRNKRLATSFLRVWKTQGPRAAVAKAAAVVYRHAPTGHRASSSARKAAVQGRDDRRRYVASYLAGRIDREDARIARTVVTPELQLSGKVVIYPLTYPLALTQRPDHVLRCLANRGYTCFMLQFDDDPPFARELGPGVYLTNIFAGLIYLFSRVPAVLYLSSPFYGFLTEHLTCAVTVYDVLDDLAVLVSDGSGAMDLEHLRLLAEAEVTIYSSQLLQEANRAIDDGAGLLVQNGVWEQDFFVGATEREQVLNLRQREDEVIIGYHGVITELLDWQLLHELLEIPKVRLVLIGPIASFGAPESGEALAHKTAVLASARTTHIPPVPYSDLKYHLAGFDAAIVPFTVNTKTDPVLPVKMFEYMAVGLYVFATRTKTLEAFADVVDVAEAAAIPDRVRSWIDRADRGRPVDTYGVTLRNANWQRQMDPVIDKLPALERSQGATYDRRPRVDLVNVAFFDAAGEILHSGGAERYIFDLCQVFLEMGWQPRILQIARVAFERDYRGVPVIGIPLDGWRDFRAVSQRYRRTCADTDLIVASPVELACALGGRRVVGISHGIHWDVESRALTNPMDVHDRASLFDALKVCQQVVAVDTNFINWTRTQDWALAAKVRFLPNYFDSAQFTPREKDFGGALRFIFPRRLYRARGIHLVVGAFHRVLADNAEAELHIVGQAVREQEDEVRHQVSELSKAFPGRVRWSQLQMEDMNEAYSDSHVALIPTTESEGTSLSCIEAMATNNAVIATNIGGLPNLIINDYNGLLIDPTEAALVAAVGKLLADRESVARMARRGLDVATAFEKQRWVEGWREIILEQPIPVSGRAR